MLMKYSAAIIGATGLTGSKLVGLLFENEQYDRVVTLSRKRNKLSHRKHESHIADLFDSATYKEFLKVDHLYICTGTTRDKTPNKDEYYRVEHDLPLQAAEVALSNGVKKVIVISALGADPGSRFMYNKGKGEMERDIEKLGFEEAYFVQPALIGGEREEQRKFESAWKKFQKLIDPLLISFLKKYRTIEPEIIAQSMIYVALNGHKKSRIESDELIEIASL